MTNWKPKAIFLDEKFDSDGYEGRAWKNLGMADYLKWNAAIGSPEKRGNAGPCNRIAFSCMLVLSTRIGIVEFGTASIKYVVMTHENRDDDLRISAEPISAERLRYVL